MKNNRFLDFAIMLFALDIFNFFIHVGLWLVFGPVKDDQALSTLSTILSAVAIWIKLGLAMLLFKKVPFRTKDTLAFKKVWILSFFWPLIVMKQR